MWSKGTKNGQRVLYDLHGEEKVDIVQVDDLDMRDEVDARPTLLKS